MVFISPFTYIPRQHLIGHKCLLTKLFMTALWSHSKHIKYESETSHNNWNHTYSIYGCLTLLGQPYLKAPLSSPVVDFLYVWLQCAYVCVCVSVCVSMHTHIHSCKYVYSSATFFLLILKFLYSANILSKQQINLTLRN